MTILLHIFMFGMATRRLQLTLKRLMFWKERLREERLHLYRSGHLCIRTNCAMIRNERASRLRS